MASSSRNVPPLSELLMLDMRTPETANSKGTTMIIIAEDQQEFSDELADLLRSAGYVVKQCANGAELLAAIKDHRPDLVLLDMMMPILDGWEVLRSLQQDKSTIPIAVLTAITRDEQAALYKFKQVRTVLDKTDVEILLKKIGYLIQKHKESTNDGRPDRHETEE